tara:strand:+ start:3023 stop:3931 length:909 start_codon:yes stop_codon:yes gene_type:complete
MPNTFTLVLGETPVTFDLVESPVVDTWKEILLNSKNYDCPLEFSQRTINTDIQALSDELSEIISTLRNEFNFLLPNWSGLDGETYNQSELNSLHEQFHKQEDELSREELQQTTGDQKQLFLNLNRLNKTIHGIEAASANNQYAICSLSWSHVKNIPGGDPRVKITEEMRKCFISVPEDASIPEKFTAYLELGYHTIGKNVRMCYHDNDAELIRDSLNSPQLKISSEFCICVRDIIFAEEGIEVLNPKINDWLEENNLTSLVDMEAPENKYNLAPLLGTTNFDSEELVELIENNKSVTDFYFS